MAYHIGIGNIWSFKLLLSAMSFLILSPLLSTKANADAANAQALTYQDLPPGAINILNAGYGNDQYPVTSSGVVAKLRDVVNRYGFIAIPGDMNKFFGFDPWPGLAKTTAIALELNGRRVSPDLRAPEGTDFFYPPGVDPARAQKALRELSAK